MLHPRRDILQNLNLAEISFDSINVSKQSVGESSNYVYPSVESLQHLQIGQSASTDRPPVNQRVSLPRNSLQTASHAKSLKHLQNIAAHCDISQISSISSPNRNSKNDLSSQSYMTSSIQLSNELTQTQKKKQDLSLRNLFNKHLKYIQIKSQSSLDSIRADISQAQALALSPASQSTLINLKSQLFIEPTSSDRQKTPKSMAILPPMVSPRQIIPKHNNSTNNLLQPRLSSQTNPTNILRFPSLKNIHETNEKTAASIDKLRTSIVISPESARKNQSMQSSSNLIEELISPLKRKIEFNLNSGQINNNNNNSSASTRQIPSLKKDTPVKRKQLLSHYMLIDLVVGKLLATHFLDKFSFFSTVPVGGVIAVRQKQLNDSLSISKSISFIESTTDSGFQTDRKQQSDAASPNSKNKQSTAEKYASILKKQIALSKEIREIQENKLCVMSKRLSTFFTEPEPIRSQNQTVFDQFLTQCRNMGRLLQVLFSLEKNQTKNLTYLKRLFSTKPYLLHEIIDEQFSRVHLAVIYNLENVLLNENTLLKYFPPQLEFKDILQETYLKDLLYLNGQLQVYLNVQSVTAAGKIADVIRSEFRMVKEKERKLIFDQIDNNAGQIVNSNLKKSYNFFNDYLYNIKPNRNVYEEIQQFEKNYGSFAYLNQIDRDIFQNLEKSNSHIRTSNRN